MFSYQKKLNSFSNLLLENKPKNIHQIISRKVIEIHKTKNPKNKTTFFLIIICCFITPLLLINCTKQHPTFKEIDINRINIERFDQDFQKLNLDRFQKLKKKYPSLFPKQKTTEFWIQKSNDSLQLEIVKAIQEQFKDGQKLKEQLHKFFESLLYYEPKQKIPTIISLSSDVDYKHRILHAKDTLLIALDNYLGTNHKFYQSMPVFISKNLNPEYITSDIAKHYAQQRILLPKDRSFLARVIYEGKILYYKSLLLEHQLKDHPNKENIILKQDIEKTKWLKDNEVEIWRYFVTKKLLYSTDRNLSNRFLFPAPFSKFRLSEIDTQAPDRCGNYIGYQIIKSYIKQNPKTSLEQLLATQAQAILSKSAYQP